MPNTWYHVAARADGTELELIVNEAVEARAPFPYWLHTPPSAEHGDVTFGCGMFACAPADPCSCLLNEVRMSDGALAPEQLLWHRSVTAHPLPPERRQRDRLPAAV